MAPVVTDAEGEGAGVLIRAAEVVAGHGLVAERRGGLRGPQALAGPAKLTRARAIDTGWTGRALTRANALHVRDAPPVSVFRVGPRVGIDFAELADRAAPWRLAVCDSAAVSHEKARTRWEGG